jgi:hypothetical protein
MGTVWLVTASAVEAGVSLLQRESEVVEGPDPIEACIRIVALDTGTPHTPLVRIFMAARA